MSAPAEKTPPVQEESQKNRKRNVWLSCLSFVFLLLGFIWLLYWLFIGRFYVYTEDAYVYGNEVLLTPQVSAGVKAIYADETNLVEKGQLVVDLDPSDFAIRVEELKKHLANEVRNVASLFQDVEAKEAMLVLRKAQLRQAELDFQHREPLVKTGAVAKEEFETYQTNAKVAEEQVRYAQKELEAAKVLIEGTSVNSHPRVQEAAWQLKQAYLNLIRCRIWSPVTGYIAKRVVQVGDQVSAGQTLLFIVPLDYIWVNANYKENQLGNVRIGQSVTYTADLYGSEMEYHGKVIGLQPGSGNAFSLLPPENASGNWIKIIQRVPVRISVDPEEIRKYPLLLGLSMRVTVDVHDTGGKTLAEQPTCKPIYTTPIYSMQLDDLAQLESMITNIIETNAYPKVR